MGLRLVPAVVLDLHFGRETRDRVPEQGTVGESIGPVGAVRPPGAGSVLPACPVFVEGHRMHIDLPPLRGAQYGARRQMVLDDLEAKALEGGADVRELLEDDHHVHIAVFSALLTE